MFRATASLVVLGSLLCVAPAQVTLSPPQLFPCGDEPDDFVLHDMDGDGDLDAVVLNEYSATYLENTGGGQYGPRVPVYTGPGEKSHIDVADLNGDNFPDLIVSTSTRVFSIPGNGDGTFAPPAADFTLANGIYELRAGEFNGDSWPDLAMPTGHHDEIYIYLGTGSWSFAPGQTIAANEAEDVAIGDFDGDGDQDLVGSQVAYYGGLIQVYLNTGFGSFVASAPVAFTGIPYESEGPNYIAAADLDDDGDLDIVGTSWRSSSGIPLGTGGYVVHALNSGSGVFTPQAPMPLLDYPGRIGVGDLSLDGVPEIVVTHYSVAGVHVIENDGTGGLTWTSTLAVGGNPNRVIIADVTTDGNSDLTVCSRNNEEIAVFANLGQSAPGTVPYPGTAEDLSLSTGVGGATPTTGVGHYVKSAVASESLVVLLTSPQGGFASLPFILAAEPFPTGAPPATYPGFPSVHMSPPGMVFLVNGNASPFPTLVGNGFTFSTIVPTFLSGQSVMFQAVALSGSAGNGVFAATDAHEIQVQ